jgi:predicted RNA-binding protein YlqC (UPF0109 family)
MTSSSNTSEASGDFKDLAEYVVGSLIDDGVDFRIEIEESDDQIKLNVFVPSEHRGQVIGRGGRIARSMRTILDCSGIDSERSVTLDIVD